MLFTERVGMGKACAFLSGLFFLMVILVGCSGGDGTSSSAALKVASAPALVANPSGRVPLAAAIDFQAAEGLDVKLVVSDGDDRREIVNSKTFQRNGSSYRIPVVGLRADKLHQITLELKDPASGEATAYKFEHQTPPLPDNQLNFPPIIVDVAEPSKMEPGVTFMSIRRRYPERGHWLTEKQLNFTVGWGRIVAVNEVGEVIWYFESESRISGIDRLYNGNLLMHRANFSTLEVDVLGNIVNHYYAGDRKIGPPKNNPDAIAIKGLQTLHHQPHELPDGNFLAFSAYGVELENYPTSELDPNAPLATQMVMADKVVIFSPEGETLWEWDTMTELDPYRIGYDTFWSYWWTRGFDQHADWSHGNGLSYNKADDSILVSLRNQLAVLKIDRKTKQIKWILGRHDDWSEELQKKLLKPVGEPFMWFGYQHNPRYTDKGTVIMFDNRSNGARLPFEPRPPFQDNFSRAVEYEINEDDMTVRQIWTTGDEQGEDPCFSNAMSEAWRLPITDNRLVFHAYCLPLWPELTEDIMDHTKRAADDLPFPGGPVLEFKGDELVFKLRVKDPDDLIQWEVYGGFRSSSFYK